ncbi:MAG TPA: lysophospholipid acyltransferase family protein [Longimicrobiales bacterium]
MRELRYRVAGRLGQLVLDALLATARFEVGGAEHYRRYTAHGKPVIFVLWHGRLLPLAYLHRRQGIAALISRSADGEYLARVLMRWGYVPVRGSSSRGGSAALRELVRHARSGRCLAITPDGPRGPRQRLKDGVLVASQLTGLPLVPLAAGADRAWWVEGWDRFLIPREFARVRVAYGPPLCVPRDADAGELDEIRRTLQAELDRLTSEVDSGGAVRRRAG